MANHQLIVTTEQLDLIVKSLMTSITANTQKRRRLREGSQQAKQAARDGDNLTHALTTAIAAQAESWSEA